MLRCRNCGEKVSRFPIKDSNGKIIWINLFKMDLMSVMWFIVIIFMIISYRADMKQAMEIIENPLKYCEESNACKIIEERKTATPYGAIDLNDILNLSNATDS